MCEQIESLLAFPSNNNAWNFYASRNNGMIKQYEVNYDNNKALMDFKITQTKEDQHAVDNGGHNGKLIMITTRHQWIVKLCEKKKINMELTIVDTCYYCHYPMPKNNEH